MTCCREMTPPDQVLIEFSRVERLGLRLADVEIGTSYGAPALKVHGRMFACVPTHRSAERGSLAVRMSLVERDLRMRDRPDIYYVKPHALGEPGRKPNFGTRTRMTNYVYLTATLDAAKWGAELAAGEGPGRIYMVEPTGPFEDDPNFERGHHWLTRP